MGIAIEFTAKYYNNKTQKTGAYKGPCWEFIKKRDDFLTIEEISAKRDLLLEQVSSKRVKYYTVRISVLSGLPGFSRVIRFEVHDLSKLELSGLYCMIKRLPVNPDISFDNVIYAAYLKYSNKSNEIPSFSKKSNVEKLVAVLNLSESLRDTNRILLTGALTTNCFGMYYFLGISNTGEVELLHAENIDDARNMVINNLDCSKSWTVYDIESQ